MTRRTIIIAVAVLIVAGAGGAAVWLLADGDDGRRTGALVSGKNCPSDPLVLDLGGNGVDLGGKTTTSLFGCTQTIRWTRTGSDDSFVVIDANAARSGGYNIRNASGAPASGNLLVRSGYQIMKPDGSSTTATDALKMLAAFDSNQDGKISANDGVWRWLARFTDADANGAIGSNELAGISGAAESISLEHGQKSMDRYGNTQVRGSFISSHGQVVISIIAVLIGL